MDSGMPLSAAERALLAPYVTSLDAPVFALKNLPEEVIAVLFAYYSRSREDLRANLLRLLQDQELGVAPGSVRQRARRTWPSRGRRQRSSTNAGSSATGTPALQNTPSPTSQSSRSPFSRARSSKT